ncbi:bifunctional 3-(3-hydroxy-phenyl)propionate/3-hydroxycinnamic acid hydroxylase [Ramlibacter sp. XY19]|uniref:bifunctional 3-(3-hydroxy-phenyl)propionate/3-hydroxycinnamic acid hydroxylase n=1 Tax=Ramlibacter paludis TaxID=2908000 RepID=UPI0023DBB7C2|nr:bifunctional 3-(3-hydroxy-phenyl)propionate/3-hydroxycinnamic acid hydroxylase [Ramlibacter paludis]MCG2592384.1 bifunctional 3-(3-hydroxy-phenyl)propionate/3-hydroxycinnamic acid hydroxylase [Ramlibacter paludis]
MYDVAIVGYGPAGVVAAGLLGQAGLKVYACDRLAEVYRIPRAIALDHEIMRVFQQLGVVDAIAPFCEPFTPSEYFGVDGQLIRRMTMVEPPYPQGYTPSIVFTQPKVEQVLRDRVAQLPNVRVDLGVEMKRIVQDAEGVTLELSNGTVRAKYAIACDGGSSTVRTQLDMPLEDLDFDEPWLVVDVLVNERGLAKLPETSVQYCEPERPCTLVIGPKNHRRWEISLKPGEDPKQVATDEETWKLLARWLTPEDGQLWRQASYRFHALVAAQWRKGRVFLAGDAAHMQPPFLGQGMCQGVRDVTNLAWKLVAVLRGEAPDALLDTYGAERKAHVRELTSRIKGVGAVICERDPVKARARDAKMLADCGGVVQDTPRQDILPRLETGLLSAQASSARGSLFPQPWLKSGQRMDEVAGHGWRLALAAGVQPPAASAVRVVSLADEREGVAAAWFRKNECVAALVRPDNYVYGVAASEGEVPGLLREFSAALA